MSKSARAIVSSALSVLLAVSGVPTAALAEVRSEAQEVAEYAAEQLASGEIDEADAEPGSETAAELSAGVGTCETSDATVDYDGLLPNISESNFSTLSSTTATPGKLTDGWTQIGSCEWKAWEVLSSVGKEGTCQVWIRPLGNGDSGELPAGALYGTIPVDTTEIEITGNVKISSCESLFSGFNKLVKLSLVGLNTSAVTNMSRMFAECKNLESVDISSLDTSNVQDMSYMFTKCRLAAFDLSELDTSAATSMKGMFYYSLSGGKNIDVTSFNTSCVTDMESMFEGCSKTPAISLKGLDASSVTNARDMFSCCSSATVIFLPSFVNADSISCSYMFYKCSSLTTVNSDALSGVSNANMYGQFYGCSSISKLLLSDISATTTNNMFSGCTSLSEIQLSNFSTKSPDGMFSGCSALKKANLKNFCTTTLSGLFESCSSLTDFTLTCDYSVSTVDCSNMLKDLTGLKSASIGGGETFIFEWDVQWVYLIKQPGYF